MTDKSDDGRNGASQFPPKKDAFLVKPIILVVVLYLIDAVLWYADISTFYIFLNVLAGLIVAAVFLFVGIKRMVQGHYISALFPILIISFLFLLLPSAPYVAYYIKFTLHEKQYFEEIKMAEPDVKGFRYKEFDWGRGSADRTALIYDESDEFELPEATRSKAWRKKVDEHSGILSCPYAVHKIKSHFFVVVEDCP